MFPIITQMPAAAKTPKEIIEMLLQTGNIEDVLDLSNIKESYNKLVLLIHPDKCGHPKASEATAKLNSLKARFLDGVNYTDDAGAFNTNDYIVRFKGTEAALKLSLDNYNRLKSVKDNISDDLGRHLPQSMTFEKGELVVKLRERAIPLTGLSLPQEHVNWILSRLLEFSYYVSRRNYAHIGISPESVFIMPKTHGIQVVSFYHMARIGERVRTVSNIHKPWYPASLFDTKTATAKVDLELSKKTGIYLLGDKSGSGIRLKKTHNEAFINFVITQHHNPAECFTKYREMLKANFETKFFPLNI